MYRRSGLLSEHGCLFGNVLGIYDDRLDLVICHHRSVFNHNYSVAEVADEMMLVGDHNNGGAALIYLVEQRNDLVGHIGVDVSGGFVGQNHCRIVYKGSGKGHTLLLTARKLGGIASGLFGQSNDV